MENSVPVFVCSLCSARSPSLSLWMSHLRQVHSNEASLNINCPLHDCSAVYGNVHSLFSHIYRKHPHRDSTHGSSNSGTTIALGSTVTKPQNLKPVEENESVAELSIADSSTDHDIIMGGEDYTEQSSVHENIDYCFERKKKSCLLLMQLKEERMLAQTAINDVVKGCQDVVSYALSSVKSKVNDLPSHSSTDEIEAVKTKIVDAIDGVVDPFAGLETSYLQDKFIMKELGCIVCYITIFVMAYYNNYSVGSH